MPAPRPQERPHAHEAHGVIREDAWSWLNDAEDPEVIAHLEAENAWTEAATAHQEDLREHLYAEMLGRIQETDRSVPAQDGPWWYLRRTEAGQAYPIWYRRHEREGAEDELVLDENTLVEGHEYLDVGAVAVSPEHTILAFTVDHDGDEVYELRFRDLATGADLPDVLQGVASVTWTTAPGTVVYTRTDDSLRPFQVWTHTLGHPVEDDVLVYEEADPTYRVGVGLTRDQRWLTIVTGTSRTTEVWLVPADAPHTGPRCFTPRHDGHEYSVDSQGDRFLVLTNDSDDGQGKHDDRAMTFALKEADPSRTGRHDWRTLTPSRPDVSLEGVDVFNTFYVLYERENGLVHLRVVTSTIDKRVPMPEEAWEVGPGENPMADQRHYRFCYTSLVTPASVVDLDLDTWAWTIRKEQTVLGTFDRRDYLTQRINAVSADGTVVPISLVHRRDVVPDGNRPTLLYGYGAYALAMDPSFSSTRLSLLDRGVVYAIAHVRGGTDLGRSWYEAARGQKKQRTFDDFIACARALIAEGWTSPRQLCIEGGSAGGLLVGAVLNQAPGLFRAAVAEVPFVDVVTSMSDPSLPLTTSDYPEWGNPENKDDFRAMLAWSPYDNVRDQPYPDLLVTAGLNDPRVAFWEPVKWVARLRDRAQGDPNILLRVWMGAGHGGSSGRYGFLRDLAFIYGWLIDTWGLEAS